MAEFDFRTALPGDIIAQISASRQPDPSFTTWVLDRLQKLIRCGWPDGLAVADLGRMAGFRHDPGEWYNIRGAINEALTLLWRRLGLSEQDFPVEAQEGLILEWDGHNWLFRGSPERLLSEHLLDRIFFALREEGRDEEAISNLLFGFTLAYISFLQGGVWNMPVSEQKQEAVIQEVAPDIVPLMNALTGRAPMRT